MQRTVNVTPAYTWASPHGGYQSGVMRVREYMRNHKKSER